MNDPVSLLNEIISGYDIFRVIITNRFQKIRNHIQACEIFLFPLEKTVRWLLLPL